MIVSASYRTDIPAFHADWFARRLEAGAVWVTNPYGGPPSRVDLSPQAASGFVFWTRNAGPFLPILDRLADQGRPFVVQITITGYPIGHPAGARHRPGGGLGAPVRTAGLCLAV